MNTRRQTLIALALAMAAGAPALADTLYKCTDGDGHATYTNNKAGAKNCIVLSREQPVSNFVAPKSPRANASAPTPADFPKVGVSEQKARDSDRRVILDQELAAEQKNLDEARRTLSQQEAAVGGKGPERLKPYQEAVLLHERNIEALKKEIANLK